MCACLCVCLDCRNRFILLYLESARRTQKCDSVVLKDVTLTSTATETATATLPRRHVFITVSAAIRVADHTHIYARVRTVVLECEAYSQFVGFSAFHYFETVVHDGIRSL